MQRLDHALVDLGVLVLGHLEDVGHRIAIAGERELGLQAGVQRRLALDRRGDVIEARVIALDAVRALDRPREGRSSQRAEPTPGLRDPVAQIVA